MGKNPMNLRTILFAATSAAALASTSAYAQPAAQQVEELRDGDSAKYGSDAIGGVINLRLREASSGGYASVTVGQYNTDVKTKPSPTPIPGLALPTGRKRRDGTTITAAGWQGLPLFG